jgi:hypothetical protein
VTQSINVFTNINVPSVKESFNKNCGKSVKITTPIEGISEEALDDYKIQ